MKRGRYSDPWTDAMTDNSLLLEVRMTNTAITGATFDIDGGQQLVEQ